MIGKDKGEEQEMVNRDSVIGVGGRKGLPATGIGGRKGMGGDARIVYQQQAAVCIIAPTHTLFSFPRSLPFSFPPSPSP